MGAVPTTAAPEGDDEMTSTVSRTDNGRSTRAPSRRLDMGRVTPQLLDRLARRVTTLPAERETHPSYAPFSGDLIGHVPIGTADDVVEAVRRAREAQREWAKTSFAERSRIFLRYHDMILDRQAEILDLIQVETGKARKSAFEEVADVAVVSRYYAHTAAKHLAPTKRWGALPVLTSTWEHHHPKGVIGLITPWNYPLNLPITDAVPALMAGNAVVLKPDAQTPFTALWGVDLLIEAGLPAELFQVVTGAGRRLGSPLIDNVDFIMFTGSTATGRHIARQAGERLIGCSLELGGKNAMIVCSDANLDKAVDGAVRACYSNSGQMCVSIERLYVEAPVYDAFVDRFVERVRGMRLNSRLDYSADMGSLISREQLDAVTTHVRDAVDKGATVLAGGTPRPEVGPLFYAPTVLGGVTRDMALYTDETFGPVVAVYPVATRDEAVERANNTVYGLNASVWTRNTAAGIELASRLQAGTANVNEAYAAAWASVDSHMGGWKDSGLGRRHGVEGIRKYTEAQTVAVQRGLPLAAPGRVSEETYAKLLTVTLKVLKRVPFIP